MDYSARGEKQCTPIYKTTKFKSQLGRDYNEPQTAVPSEPGEAYSTPAPSNGSLTEQNSPKQPQTS